VRCGPIRTMIVENLFHLESEVRNTSFDEVFKRFAAGVPKEIGRVMDPADVAANIYKIAIRPHPKALYRINNRLSLRMLKWIPFGILERAVGHRLK
jgi:hypothetical protein